MRNTGRVPQVSRHIAPKGSARILKTTEPFGGEPLPRNHYSLFVLPASRPRPATRPAGHGHGPRPASHSHGHGQPATASRPRPWPWPRPRSSRPPSHSGHSQPATATATARPRPPPPFLGIPQALGQIAFPRKIVNDGYALHVTNATNQSKFRHRNSRAPSNIVS